MYCWISKDESINVFSNGLLHADMPVLVDQQKPIETDGLRESRESVLSAQLDDNDELSPYILTLVVINFFQSRK